MTNETLAKLIWALIYGGLLVISLGLFVSRQDGAFGGTLIVVGTLAAAAGAVLIWIRSRRGP
jgi:hypothetical protein